MKHDRLRRDRDEIHNLDDLIEARAEHTSHFTDDTNSLQEDVELPEDTDVEDALTFPHPHRKKKEEPPDLMTTPHARDMADDQPEWTEQELLPSDYAHGYDEGSTSDPNDDRDEVLEERLHEIWHVDTEDMADEPPIEQMPGKFVPEE